VGAAEPSTASAGERGPWLSPAAAQPEGSSASAPSKPTTDQTGIRPGTQAPQPPTPQVIEGTEAGGRRGTWEAGYTVFKGSMTQAVRNARRSFGTTCGTEYGLVVSEEPLPFFSRLMLAYVAWFRVLADGAYARRVSRLDEPEARRPELASPQKSAKADTSADSANERKPLAAESKPAPPAPAAPGPVPGAEAIALLARLQAEGRLLDFLEDDVKAYSDAEVGSAARVIHEGCRRALREVLPVVPLSDEAEGDALVLAADFDKDVYKLTGNVSGSAPYRGVVRHRGWRVTEVKLGVRTTSPKNESHALIVAPAEVEL
jgi:hypothetical protein